MALNTALTLVAVRSCESLLTLAAEMPTGVASTAPVRTTHTGGEEARAARSAVRRHGNRAAVNHWGEIWTELSRVLLGQTRLDV